LVLLLGIVKASLEMLGIGIGVKKVVLLMSAEDPGLRRGFWIMSIPLICRGRFL